jgi:hypothetical protein
MRALPFAATLSTLLLGGVARAQGVEEAPPPPPAEPAAANAHTFVELRLGLVGLSPLGKSEGGALRYGPAVETSIGMAWTWLDVGLVGRLGTVPSAVSARTTYAAFGPEIAARKYLGARTTLRFGVVPLYASAWGGELGAHGRVGVDGIVQLLFTLDDVSRPAWRSGVGLRVGRWWSATTSADPGWTVGLDLLIRSWW